MSIKHVWFYIKEDFKGILKVYVFILVDNYYESLKCVLACLIPSSSTCVCVTSQEPVVECLFLTTICYICFSCLASIHYALTFLTDWFIIFHTKSLDWFSVLYLFGQQRYPWYSYVAMKRTSLTESFTLFIPNLFVKNLTVTWRFLYPPPLISVG